MSGITGFVTPDVHNEESVGANLHALTVQALFGATE
jgi:hypothetical protein